MAGSDCRGSILNRSPNPNRSPNRSRGRPEPVTEPATEPAADFFRTGHSANCWHRRHRLALLNGRIDGLTCRHKAHGVSLFACFLLRDRVAMESGAETALRETRGGNSWCCGRHGVRPVNADGDTLQEIVDEMNNNDINSAEELRDADDANM